MNDGECVMMNDRLGCKCKAGFAGMKCEVEVAKLPACSNVTHLREDWRSVNNTHTMQIGNCDSKRLGDGWFRFSFEDKAGQLGKPNKVHESKCVESLNTCGGKFPGSILGEHPSTAEVKVTRQIAFYSSYCNSDRAQVEITNCVDFFSYNFSYLPWYSCDYVICTSSV
jgi:hypothetical protein